MADPTFHTIMELYQHGTIADYEEFGIQLPSREEVAQQTAASLGVKPTEISDAEYGGLLEMRRDELTVRLLGACSLESAEAGQAAIRERLHKLYEVGLDQPRLRQFSNTVSGYCLQQRMKAKLIPR